MDWPRYTLREVAPAIPSRKSLDPDVTVWHLGLDQIEGHTGVVLSKHRAPVSEAGNSTFHFDQSHVLYSKLRPYLNKVVVPGEPGIATTELIPLQPRPHLACREFLAYYLRSTAFLAYASQYVTGAKMPRVILEKFWAHKISIPPLSEQRRIVEILDQADRIRRLRAEADAKAERILPALFIKMFGAPATNPMGLPVKRFDRICESRLGKMLDQRQQTGQHPRPYLRNANVYWNRLDLNKVLEMDFDESDREEFRLRKGDILICEGGEVGRCTIWNDELPECYFQKALHRVRPFPGAATPEFIVYLFWQLARFGALEGTVSKMTFSHLTGVKLKALQIPVPPLALQEKFSIQVRATKKVLDQTELARNRISSLFNGLLHRAFSGALTASWRKEHMKQLLQEMEQQTRAEAAP